MSAPTDERTNEKKKTTLHRLNYDCQLKPDCQKKKKLQIKTRNKTKRLPSQSVNKFFNFS